MSSLNILIQNVDEFFLERQESFEDDEVNRPTEFFAAVRLQAAYRGYFVRKNLKKLNECAVKIQSAWRGYKAKEIYRQKLLESVREMREDFYNRAATVIQKRWRGYRSRKHNGDFYKRKEYLEWVHKAYLKLIERTKAEPQPKDSSESLLDYKQKKRLLENWAIKNHHLISTYSQPGAYRSKGKIIKAKRPLSTVNDSEAYEGIDSVLLPSINFLKMSQMDGYERKSQTYKSLETKAQKTYEGPFRPAADVAHQRRKALSPTLRVMTDFYSAEKASENDRLRDWALRLNDGSFMFGRPKSPMYQKLITAEGTYNPPAYGRTHFRSAIDSDKNEKNSSTTFKTTLPPIPLFSRFGREYFPRYVES